MSMQFYKDMFGKILRKTEEAEKILKRQVFSQ